MGFHGQAAQGEMWVGRHSKTGVVVYDPRAQVAAPSNRVRLFVVAERKMVKFDRETVERQVAMCFPPESESAISTYQQLRSRSRATHCYACKRDLNSVDFHTCERCGWISCECGACGCDVHDTLRT
jgi:hypothetical protein